MEAKKPRFILMYDFLYEVGGLEKLMTIHANYLKKEGHEVLLLFADIDNEILKHKTFDGLSLKEYGIIKKSFIKVFSAILGFNKINDIIMPGDIIISYSFPVNVTIRRMKNKKIFYMNHYPNFLYLPLKEKIIWANNLQRKIAAISSLLVGFALRVIDRQLVKKNELIFENSEFTKKKLDKIYGVDGIVSYPPVSNDFKPIKDTNVLKKYEINKNFIFCSGRVIPDKRIDWLITAFSFLENKNMLLIISGQIGDKEKKKLEGLAKKLNVNNKIKFLGIVPKEDLIVLYSMAKVYAFPAPKEDFGLVPAEAISCGAPVIVWGDGAGPTEIVIQNINGYHAEPYNLNDFSKRISEAMNKKWNKKGIVKSSKKFSENFQKRIFLNAVNKVL